MQDWINARRAEVKAQQEQTIGTLNQISGALSMLDAMEAELKKPSEKSKKK